MQRRLRRLAASVVVIVAAGSLPVLGLTSADAADPVYKSSAKPATSDKAGQPSKYTPVTIDLDQLRATLDRAPGVASRGPALTFRLPNPTGGVERFAIKRSQLMESELAAAHPEIRTYSGRSLDHAGTTVALDVSPLGLHASVRGPVGQNAWYIDPAAIKRGETDHISYYGGDVTRSEDEFVERETKDITRAIDDRAAGRATAPGKLVKQRIYRLALTSDPSYAAYFGTANVLAAKVSLMTRVNQIYNDDLAIDLRLVNATDSLNLDTAAKATLPNGPCGAHACFDVADPTDPDSYGQLDFCSGATLGRNRTVLGQLVGASNYDIGHIALGVNGGGVAYLGVVGADYKGGGCTGLPQPRGDFFAIDYVAHEMGHQFAGNHTFNGVKGACSGGNRNAGTSVEPGSGSSVMAYAGICGTDDLQSHSDPYFSERTQSEASAYTGAPIPSVVEVQTVSLSGFDGTDSVTLGYGNAAPVTLTRGSTYNAAGIKAAIQTLTGQTVTIAQWGYEPFSDPVLPIAPTTAPDDTGFQVVFSDSLDPYVAGTHTDVAPLTFVSGSGGATAAVGETAKGGAADNQGIEVVTTRNHNPKVKAPANKTIPARTPFTLTGSGKDKDAKKLNQTLTYLWEQNDVGAKKGTSLVSNTKKNGPLFRVFGFRAKVGDTDTLETPSPGINIAGTAPTRTFPDMAQILKGNTNAKTGRCPQVSKGNVSGKSLECFSEFLPTSDYVGLGKNKKDDAKLHFRLTARDGYSLGGGTAYDDTTLTVDRSAGPFLVKNFKKSTTVRGGSKQAVTWKVNGTKRLAAQVRILLSVDNGKTWTHTLAKTANDGSATVVMPRERTKRARIMIEAVGNYFFTVNEAKIRIR